MRRGVIGAIAACLLLVLLAVPAQAKQVRYHGQTTQGQKVLLITDPQGVVKFFGIKYTADCNYDTYHDQQGFIRPFRKQNRHGFKDRFNYPVKFDNGVKAKRRARLEGTRVSADRFKGKFSFKGKFFENGKKYATCRAQGIRWTASR